MSDTVRGLIVFVTALITIALWVPLSGHAEPRPGGGSINDIYFGLFHYLTVHSEMKEPDFKITKSLSPGRLALTAAVSTGLWLVVIGVVRKKKTLPPDRPNPQ